MSSVAGAEQQRRAALKFIVCLGIVSLFADMTYEGAHSIVGPYLKELGATAAQVAFIAGFGEMLAASLRYFSGRFADRTHAYWIITFLGYSMNVIAVPAMAYAGTWQMAALLVIAERTGKALRGPARDVLLSGATESIGHGKGFGLHGIMDQTGAMLGPLIMMIAVAKTGHFGPAFLWLFFPAVGTLIALTSARVLNPGRDVVPKEIKTQELNRLFWIYVAAAGVLACGFLDFPLLAYHFQTDNLITQQNIPLLYAGAMGLNGLGALIFGRMFDRFGLNILVFGILVSALSLPLGFLVEGSGAAVASVACWAVGLGAQDACLRAGIAKVVSMNKRGSAFGSFNAVYGIAWFAGSAAMGLMYAHSLHALVAFGVVFQLIAAGMFFGLRKRLA